MGVERSKHKNNNNQEMEMLFILIWSESPQEKAPTICAVIAGSLVCNKPGVQGLLWTEVLSPGVVG
jgi:hypothetical protein